MSLEEIKRSQIFATKPLSIDDHAESPRYLSEEIHQLLLQTLAFNQQEETTTAEREKEVTRLKYLFFGFISAGVLLAQFRDGMIGAYSIISLALPIMGLAANPAAIGVTLGASAALGLVAVGMGLIFDVKALAKHMGISYLSLAQELQEITNYSKQLLIIQDNISKAIDDPNRKASLAELRTALDATKSIQEQLSSKIEKYKQEFSEGASKRDIIKKVCLITAGSLFAITASLSAIALIGMLSWASLPIMVIAGYMAYQTFVELYRYNTLEGKSLCDAVDRLFFGATKKQLDAADKAKELKEKYSAVDSKLELKTALEKNKVAITEKEQKVEEKEITLHRKELNTEIKSKKLALMSSIHETRDEIDQLKKLNRTFRSEDLNSKSILELIKIEKQLKEHLQDLKKPYPGRFFQSCGTESRDQPNIRRSSLVCT